MGETWKITMKMVTAIVEIVKVDQAGQDRCEGREETWEVDLRDQIAVLRLEAVWNSTMRRS